MLPNRHSPRTLEAPQFLLWLTSPFLVSPMSTSGFLQRGLSPDSSIRNQAKARQPGRQDSDIVYMGGTCVSLLFELCCCLGESSSK